MASASGSQLYIEKRTDNMIPHPALSAAELKASQSERFKHIGLSAFVLESAVASRIGAPSHLPSDQVNALGLLDEDGLEEWSPWHDPLSPGLSADVKAPARSFSTLNQLVRLALRNESMGWTVSGQATSTILSNVVLRLVHNGRQALNRLQPATIVLQCEFVPHDLVAEEHRLRTLPNPGGDVALARWEDKSRSEQNLSPLVAQHANHQQLSYLSIPETMKSAFSSSSAVPGNPNPTSDFWVGNGTQTVDQQLDIEDGSTVTGADLFEELAMLERTDSRQHPQFMQNLGFAPDLDLAEFLGADHQQCDPMLAYMPASFFNAPSYADHLPP
ncbi:hypothetical protein LTR08_001622 [Meristemomyces frigidus]|nr:hypothetical protein LTR08_001622 [Meristemomyces frigidus]